MSLQYLPVPYQRTAAHAPLSQELLARRCGVHPEFVQRLVSLGLVRAERGADGELQFSPSEAAAVARVQRLRSTLPLNYAALGLVVDLLDRITELETALRIRGRTEPVRPPTATRLPLDSDQNRSRRWT